MLRKLFISSFLLSSLFIFPISAFARTLTVGLSGADVITLQNQLITQGYLASGNNTGRFGSLTLSAVQKFQCAKNIACSNVNAESWGIVGPRTQLALASGTNTTTGTTVSPTSEPTSISTGGVLTGKSLTGPATGKFEISGWLPDWRTASSTADALAHLDQLGSIMPFGYTVNTSGHLVDHANIANEPWTSLIAVAKQKGVRVIPTVEWGNGTAIAAILSNQATRIALEDEITNLVKQNGFDGIDIDFEAKKVETRDNYSTFLKGLSMRMTGKLLYCTIEARAPLIDRYSPGATIPPDATDYANDYVAINRYCDRVEIMAYDQSTNDVRLDAARSAPYAPVADPGWVSDVVQLAAQNISKNKIILGIPTYGYEYLVTPVNGSFQYQRLWAFNPSYALTIASQLGITPHRTSANEIGYIYNSDLLETIAPTGGNVVNTQQPNPIATTTIVQNQGSQVDTNSPFNYVTWSDSQAIADKVQLAHQLGLRGVAIFSVGGAEDPAMWSVLK